MHYHWTTQRNPHYYKSTTQLLTSNLVSRRNWQKWYSWTPLLRTRYQQDSAYNGYKPIVPSTFFFCFFCCNRILLKRIRFVSFMKSVRAGFNCTFQPTEYFLVSISISMQFTLSLLDKFRLICSWIMHIERPIFT